MGYDDLIMALKGNHNSGNRGHRGTKGKRGGSVPGSGGFVSDGAAVGAILYTNAIVEGQGTPYERKVQGGQGKLPNGDTINVTIESPSNPHFAKQINVSYEIRPSVDTPRGSKSSFMASSIKDAYAELDKRLQALK